MNELVHLPDPALQPLVHPLDLREARRPFRISWLVGALTNPPVALCLAALTWFASGSYVVPLIAGAALIGFGALAGRYYAEQAWAFIPRKRQDRTRPLPIGWQLAANILFPVELAAVLVLVLRRLDQLDVSTGVRQVTLWMSLAVGLVVLGQFVVLIARGTTAGSRR
ncbi:hypothetical protein [Amycolatopsis sp. GM8]|uniref:hypothetical protein n=1 Tax=Amycolatopsis sp. GM8 TaxID=2896530 RepID=UPI001F28513F|nr:hypothetical protein [Amycolatopsis sp. GM8]